MNHQQQKTLLRNQINQLKSENLRLINEVKVLNRSIVNLNKIVQNHQNCKNKIHQKQLSSERLQQSNQSLSIMQSLNKGIQYIVQRYQIDINQLILSLKNMNRNKQTPIFKSQSKLLFEQLWQQIIKIFKIKKQQHLQTEQKSIQIEMKENEHQKKHQIIKLIKKYEEMKLENDNHIKLIGNLLEIIQRLSYNHQMQKYKSLFLNKTITQFAQLNCLFLKKSKQIKVKKVVISIKFIFRLKKTSKITLSKIKNVNLQLIQNKNLYHQIYRSYVNNFQPNPTEKQIRKSISKFSSQKTLTRLLNLQFMLPKKNLYVESMNINFSYWKNIIKMAQEYDTLANRLISLNKYMETQENKIYMQQQYYKRELKQKDYQLQKSSNIIRILKKRIEQQKIKN